MGYATDPSQMMATNFLNPSSTSFASNNDNFYLPSDPGLELPQEDFLSLSMAFQDSVLASNSLNPTPATFEGETLDPEQGFVADGPYVCGCGKTFALKCELTYVIYRREPPIPYRYLLTNEEPCCSATN